MTTPADTYNYDTFRPAAYIEGGCDGPEPGKELGELTVYRLNGEPAKLRHVLAGTAVIEAGSTTCPLYRGNVRRMRAVAARHPDARFLVLYTREAHPGERRGPHIELQDKIGVAGELPNEAGEWREILVDDIDGTFHRQLAGAPNSVLVLNGNAVVEAWMHDADPDAVDCVLEDLESGRSPRTRTRFRPPPPHVALRALWRGGAKAFWDFTLALPSLIRYRLSGGASC